MFYFDIRTEVYTIPDVEGIFMPTADHAIGKDHLVQREIGNGTPEPGILASAIDFPCAFNTST